MFTVKTKQNKEVVLFPFYELGALFINARMFSVTLHLKSKTAYYSSNFKGNKDQKDLVIVTKSKSLF